MPTYDTIVTLAKSDHRLLDTYWNGSNTTYYSNINQEPLTMPMPYHAALTMR